MRGLALCLTRRRTAGDVPGQFTTLKWIISGASVLGVAAASLLFTKVDALEDTAARNTAILERIEKAVSDVASKPK